MRASKLNTSKLIPILSASPDDTQCERYELWIDDRMWEIDVRSFDDEPVLNIPVTLRTRGHRRNYNLQLKPSGGLQLVGASDHKTDSWSKK